MQNWCPCHLFLNSISFVLFEAENSVFSIHLGKRANERRRRRRLGIAGARLCCTDFGYSFSRYFKQYIGYHSAESGLSLQKRFYSLQSPILSFSRSNSSSYCWRLVTVKSHHHWPTCSGRLGSTETEAELTHSFLHSVILHSDHV